MILKSGNSKMIVGYDLGHTCSRISYYSADTKKVETAASVAGTQIYNIPTVLCKRYQVNQWLYGREAVRAAAEEEGILVDDLIRLAMDGEPVQIEGEPYDPVSLLTLFIKRSLGLLSMAGTIDRIGAFLITCEQLDARLMEVLSQALAGVGLKAKHICFQSYEESFYQYMIHQPRELWEFQTVMLHYEEQLIRVYRMSSNGRTTPRAMVIGQEEYPFLPVPEAEGLFGMRGTEGAGSDHAADQPALEKSGPAGQSDGESGRQMDREFLRLVTQICGNERISSIYLVGELFDTEWMKESLRFLCQGRRVFLGSNLYSQGACLGMMERLKPSAAAANTVLLGTDKLKANIGMRAARQGEDSYCALLDAGTSWYEAVSDCECYLKEENSFELVITPLNGKKGKLARMTLEGLPEGISRIHLHLQMENEQKLQIVAEDLGFGEFRAASGQVWQEEILLYD